MICKMNGMFLVSALFSFPNNENLSPRFSVYSGRQVSEELIGNGSLLYIRDEELTRFSLSNYTE